MANKFIEFTIKGMNFKYYLRHMLLISPLPLALFILPFSAPTVQIDLVIMSFVFFGILWILYPYSRFAYESLFRYITGDKIFIASSSLSILAKIVTDQLKILWDYLTKIVPISKN